MKHSGQGLDLVEKELAKVFREEAARQAIINVDERPWCVGKTV